MTELEKLRRRVSQLAPGKSRRYPAELREQLVAAAKQLRNEGLSFQKMAKTIGVAPVTLQRWCTKSERKVATFVPVDVVTSGGGELVLTTPSGFRIEPLDIESTIRIVRALS